MKKGIPWKSLATIFYRLVSEPPSFKMMVDFQGIDIELRFLQRFCVFTHGRLSCFIWVTNQSRMVFRSKLLSIQSTEETKKKTERGVAKNRFCEYPSIFKNIPNSLAKIRASFRVHCLQIFPLPSRFGDKKSEKSLEKKPSLEWILQSTKSPNKESINQNQKIYIGNIIKVKCTQDI